MLEFSSRDSCLEDLARNQSYMLTSHRSCTNSPNASWYGKQCTNHLPGGRRRQRLGATGAVAYLAQGAMETAATGNVYSNVGKV